MSTSLSLSVSLCVSLSDSLLDTFSSSSLVPIAKSPCFHIYRSTYTSVASVQVIPSQYQHQCLKVDVTQSQPNRPSVIRRQPGRERVQYLSVDQKPELREYRRLCTLLMSPYTSYDNTDSQDIFPIRNTHARQPLSPPNTALSRQQIQYKNGPAREEELIGVICTVEYSPRTFILCTIHDTLVLVGLRNHNM